MAGAHNKSAVRAEKRAGGSKARSSSRLDAAERRALVDRLNAEARSIRRLDYERDRLLAEEAFELASQPDEGGTPYVFGMATSLSLLAHRNCILGELDLALSQASQALGLLEPPTPSVVLGDLYDCIGWAHFCLGDLAEAMEFLMRALAVAEAIDDPSLEAYVLDSIGSIHTQSGQPEIGLETQQRALALHRRCGDEMGEALVLNNMAYSYLDLNRHDEALEAARASLSFAEAGEHRYLRMWTNDTLADIYLGLGDAEEARRHGHCVLDMAREFASEPDEAVALMSLGRSAYCRKEWDEALTHLEAALAVTEWRGLTMQTYKCHELLSDVEAHRGNFERALEHFKQFHTMKQAQVNEQTESRLANLRVTHQVETARRDAEIMRLRSLALEREVEERKIAQVGLEARASLDALTGLFNRGHLSVLDEELRVALAQGRAVSLLMFDIDRFKGVNDTYGHLAGDAALVSVARALRMNSRESDMPLRYGGDEFVILLTGMEGDIAVHTAERLREAIAARPITYGDNTFTLTISVGVATVREGSSATLHSLIGAADDALYTAKHAGRNRVVLCETSGGGFH